MTTFLPIILEEMNIADFLEQIKGINFDLDEKENQILSQNENAKRSSKTKNSKLPFTELTKRLKSKKKITFIIKKEGTDEIEG